MKKSSHFTLFIFLTFLLIQNAQQVFPQSVSRPDRGIGASVAYQFSNVENINLQNGNVGLSIPLAQLPAIAGGKLSFTLKAHYSSKLWDTYMEQYFTGPGEGSTFYNASIPKVSDFGGWKIGGAYGLYEEFARDDYRLHQGYYDIDTPILQNYIWRKTFFVTPDGSKHEIRPLGFQAFWGSNDFYRGYFKDSPYTNGAPMRYYSVDGSYIWLTLYPNGLSIAWEANLPDGTKIQQSSDFVQRIIDTNGNKIKIFSDAQGTHYQDEQTGREIRVAYNSGTNRTEIWHQTVGGVWQKVEIVFGTTSVVGKFYAIEKPDVPYNPGCTFHVPFTEELSVMREIIFPPTESNQLPPKYAFSYNSDETDPNGATYIPGCNTYPPIMTYPNPSKGLGELSQMTTPSGGMHKYSYTTDNWHIFGGLEQDVSSGTIAQKTIIHDGVTDIWNYAITPYYADVTNPDGSTQNLQMYDHFSWQPSTRGGTSGFGGLVYRETQSNNIRIERRWARQVFSGANELTTGSNKIVFNPIVAQEYISLLDNAGNPVKMSAKTFQYDYNGNVKQTTEYDWFDPNLVGRDAAGVPLGVPGGATILRVTTNSYYNSPPDANAQEVYAKTNNFILNAVKETSVGSSITRFSYDNQAYGVSPIKGNVTKVSVWNDVGSQWIDFSSSYDNYGNVISATDPKGNTTNIFYEDNTHAMPTKTIVDPQNGTGQQIATVTYDFATGAVLSQTNINGNTSTIDYTNQLLGAIDPFGRPGKVTSPYVNVEGVNKRQTVKTYYEDNARRTRVETDLFNEGDALLKSRENRDQLGRVILMEKNENGSNSYSISAQTIYKPQERVVMSSNPSRATASSTDGWTRITSDTLGRAIESATFSGAAQPPVTEINANWTGSVTTSYSANTTTVTDQAGKQRRSTANAVGQLIRVDEPNEAGQLDISGVLAQPTSYSYDVLGNLTLVSQGVQTRTFVYDSLSRLRTTQNPESGLIQYSYDANGNLTQKIDARSIQTNFAYDALNRVTQRSYANEPSGQTTPVNYTYGNLSIPFSKGRLTKVSSIVSQTEYTAFDNLGRILAHKQMTDGNAYTTGYNYNLSGALIEQTYPSGRVVKNVLDNDGDLSIVQSKKNQNTGYFNYAKNFTYTATGAVSSMKLGNGRWESTQFNSRLQPTQIALGTVQNGTDKLKLNYDYGTTQNNGNVLSQQITVPTVGQNQGFTAIQNYSYDSLNRLKSAVENVGATQTWKQTFTFDRYGNRNFDAANTTTLGSCPQAQCNPTIDPANNRFTTGQGYTFDLAGNLITDATGRSFIYDAENKQKEVKDVNNVSIGAYLYDGDGKRVKKISATETVIFVYNAGGQLVAEYSTQISQTPQVSYLTKDTLGTPRINTDANGAVIARHDYLPFGEEIARASYGTDEVKNRFTSYERDMETNLDNAQARMYGNSHGRFTSPDPYNPIVRRESSYSISLYAAQPQNWNKYSYAFNNPYRYVDRDGETPTVVTGAIGAVIGGVLGAGIETARQAIFEDEFNGSKIGGAAVQGAVFGGVAGLTLGASLVVQVGALAIANTAGGIANRAISNDPNNRPLNASGITIDAIAGGTGAYLAPLGTTRYLATTDAARNTTVSSVERLMVASPIRESFPTLMNPVIQDTVRSELYHGYAQNLSNSIVRGGTKTATTGTLNFLLNFDIARPVQSSNSGNQSGNSSNSNDSKVKVSASCVPRQDGKGQICGPSIIDLPYAVVEKRFDCSRIARFLFHLFFFL